MRLFLLILFLKSSVHSITYCISKPHKYRSFTNVLHIITASSYKSISSFFIFSSVWFSFYLIQTYFIKYKILNKVGQWTPYPPFLHSLTYPHHRYSYHLSKVNDGQISNRSPSTISVLIPSSTSKNHLPLLLALLFHCISSHHSSSSSLSHSLLEYPNPIFHLIHCL